MGADDAYIGLIENSSEVWFKTSGVSLSKRLFHSASNKFVIECCLLSPLLRLL